MAMRMLRFIGAPAAIFGYLLHLLLPITTALAYDAGARGDILEICTIAGVKRAPLTLGEAQGWPALAQHQPGPADADAGDGEADSGAARHPAYCPGTAPSVDLPALTLSLRPSAGIEPGAPPVPDQPAVPGSDPASGPSPRGPPLPV